MTDQTNTATASIAEATKGAFVNRELLSAVILNDRLDKSSRIVLAALCSYANVQQHHAWPSVAGVARRAGCTERNARSHLRQLERDGYITAVRDSAYSTTAYRIEAERLWQEQEDRTAGAPRFASTEISGGAEKAAQGAEKSVTEHTIFSAKEGKKKDIEKEKEEGGNAHAHATPLASRTTEPTFPALPPSIFENLPALNRPAVARSTALPTAPAPTPAPAPLPTSNAHPAQPQPAAAPAPHADTLVNTPAPSNATSSGNTATDTAPALPAPVAAQPEATPATAADVLPAQTVGQINAQRAKNGKGKFTAKDVATLATEADKAGITAEAAAAYILAKPTRNFFKADWYKPASAPAPAAAAEEPSIDAKRAAATLASMIPAAPQTDEEKAAAAQAAAAAKERIHQIVTEAKQSAPAPAPVPAPVAAPAQPATAPSAHDLAVAHQLAQRCADSNRTAGNVAALFTGTSAAPITTAPAAPSIATGFLPEVGPKGAHARIVNRALRGEIVSSLPLKMACQVCGLNFADVKARNASARATA